MSSSPAAGRGARPARTAGALRRRNSGSAPLPPETFAAFRALTGRDVLERYGMSETGMLASHPLHGERRAGTVGAPHLGPIDSGNGCPTLEVEKRRLLEPGGIDTLSAPS